MNKPTEELGRFATNFNFNAIPNDVIEKAKECILDTVGCIFEGSKSNGARKLKNSVALLAKGETPIWGTNWNASLGDSVLIHAAMSHSTEYDDSHKKSKTHPGSIVIPAALAGATLQEKKSGRDLLTAVIAGYEILLRMGIALDAKNHRLNGWHATSTCGIFGAAVSSGKLLDLTKEKMISALGSAGTQASGIWAFASDGSMSKQLHAGKASSGGLLSAILAKEGFTGSKYILEAEDGGFFATFAPDQKGRWEKNLTDGLGEYYEILSMAYKPYPCCRTTHCAIDAALLLQEKHHIPIEQIREVNVKTYDVAVKQCGFSSPENARLAMFSFPYVVALALKEKRPIVSQDFTADHLTNQTLMSLHDKINTIWDETIEKEFPEKWPCEVEIITYNDTKYSQKVEVAKGDPKNPMTDKDRVNKFLKCTDGILTREHSEKIIDLIHHLEREDSLTQLLNLLNYNNHYTSSCHSI